MTIGEKIQFIKNSIEPIADSAYGDGYRASVYLVDGTYIPCVRFLNSKLRTEFAIKRLEEERKGQGIFNRTLSKRYKELVQLYVTNGNSINEYDIDRIEVSDFAFPINILHQIRGETTMGYTGFCAKMRDGKIFGFGSRFLFYFFQMPKDYQAGDIIEIINHSYISTEGKVQKHEVPFLDWPSDYDENAVYHERPFFDCYIDGL